MLIHCTNKCGIVLKDEVIYIGDKPYYPMCFMNHGIKYETVTNAN